MDKWRRVTHSSWKMFDMTLAIVLLFAAVISARVWSALALTVADTSRHLENMTPNKKLWVTGQLCRRRALLGAGSSSSLFSPLVDWAEAIGTSAGVTAVVAGNEIIV